MDFLIKKMVVLFAFAGLIAVGFLVNSCGSGFRKGYRIENGEVAIYIGFPADRTVIEAADPNSFKAINDEYGNDKNHVFYRERIIHNADPASFEYLAGGYSKDKNNGYSKAQIISNDAANFTIVPNPDETPTNVTAQGIAYAHDRDRVYKGNWAIYEADPATFKMVPMFNGNYVTYDRKRVYVNDKAIEDADGQTFRKVSNFHFSDKQGVWGLSLGKETRWVRIEGADVATFEGVGNDYAKDKHRVYFGNDAIVRADPATFQETGYLTGKDKNGIYSSGVHVENAN